MHSEQQELLKLDTSDNEELKILLAREETYLSVTSDIPFERLSSHQAKWRPKIFEWFYKIIDHFGFDRDIVAAAIDILDRYQLFHPEEMDGEMYQRAAMASLYISIKINCGALVYSKRDPCARRILSLSDYAQLSRGQFSADDLTEMELCIFKTLNWKLHPIIPSNFLVPLLSLFLHDDNLNRSSPSSVFDDDHTSNMKSILTVIYEVARYLVEVSITSSEISFYLNFGFNPRKQKNKPSSVSFSALLISIDMISEQYLSQYSREVFKRRASMIMQTDEEEIRRLRHVILESFIPAVVLNGSLSQEDTSVEIYKLHPSEILRNAGIFCVQAQKTLLNSVAKEHKRRKRNLTHSPTSLLDQKRIECD